MDGTGTSNAARPMSIRLADLKSTHFDVLIVGSGYGGSIAASRLAGAGKKVCLLERGREILPGNYPRDLDGARKEMAIVTERGGPLQHDANGMMQVRVNRDVHVVIGNGLGGGSLINAGVSIEPDARVFAKGWPAAFCPDPSGDGQAAQTGPLSTYFDRVKYNLGARKLPDKYSLGKLTALEQSAKAMRQDFQRAEINVTFTAGKNAFGFEQKACNLCGDCCSGCNYDAKNTLLMNYLPDAHRSGAIIVSEAEVRTVAPCGSGWSISVLDRTKPVEGQTPSRLTSDMVVLAAGALGSTEILIRSARADRGLTLSGAIGSRFSTNGDVLAFGFGANLDHDTDPGRGPVPLYSIGAGVHEPTEPQYRPGPCITGVVRVNMDRSMPLDDGMLIEDGTAPGPFASIYPPALFLQDVLNADFADFPDAQRRLNALKELGDALQSGQDPATLSYTGVMTQMQSYLVMSHDDAGGKLCYSDRTELVYVSWPGAGWAPVYQRDNVRLKQASEAIWANFVANPIWEKGFGRNLVSVHPLGGCPMSDNDADGVTDAHCRVYKGDGRNSVYETLLVCDGSVIPTALGVNPLLTISAITEWTMDRLVGPPNKLEAAAPGQPSTPSEPPAAAPQTGIDWEEIIKDLNTTKAAVSLVGSTAGSDDRFTAGLELTELLRNLLAGVDTKKISKFATDFLANADLKSDIAPAFARLADDLEILVAAIKRELAKKKPKPLQAFLNAFFKIVGDVSPGLAFNETMRGFVSDRWPSQGCDVSDPYEIAERMGRISGQMATAEFTVDAVHTLGHDARGRVIAEIVGADLGGEVHITSPGGISTVYDVTRGTFDLLQPDPDRVETWLMTYDCTLAPKGAASGTWKMTGTKRLRRDPGSFWWTDLTTLFVDLTPVGPGSARAPMQGIVRLDLQDLAAQMTTVKSGYRAGMTADQLVAAVIAAADGGRFREKFAEGTLLTQTFLVLLTWALERTEAGRTTAPSTSGRHWPEALAGGLVKVFVGGIAQFFGELIFRVYGRYPAYMADFPSQSEGTIKTLPEPGIDKVHGSLCQGIWVDNPGGGKIRLFHFAPSDPATAKGPIVLAPGMSTTSLSFALLTIKPSLVERLLEQNYDVWLFDSRLSPRVTPIETDYTLDDVAAEDWPTAVDYVLANTPVEGPGQQTVQILAHCVGGLTAQMALLGGHVATEKVRQMVVLQFTVHPIANAFNVAKSETGLARDFSQGFPPLLAGIIHTMLGDGPDWDAVKELVEHGIPTINPVSPRPDTCDYKIPLDELHNTIDWRAPFGIDHMCYSPTCHRIFGLYGPVIAHKNLNEATHFAMRHMFGEIATKPFVQLGLIMQRGRAVSANGDDIYLPNHERLRIPFHVVSGSVNQIVQPESGFRTVNWLKHAMPKDAHLFTRTLVKGYAHNDCFIGKNSNADVFDGLMDVLRPYGSG